MTKEILWNDRSLLYKTYRIEQDQLRQEKKSKLIHAYIVFFVSYGSRSVGCTEAKIWTFIVARGVAYGIF